MAAPRAQDREENSRLGAISVNASLTRKQRRQKAKKAAEARWALARRRAAKLLGIAS